MKSFDRIYLRNRSWKLDRDKRKKGIKIWSNRQLIEKEQSNKKRLKREKPDERKLKIFKSFINNQKQINLLKRSLLMILFDLRNRKLNEFKMESGDRKKKQDYNS